MNGIHGSRSGLIRHVLDAVEVMKARPEFVLLENVPFLLKLDGGSGMAWLTSRIEELGYHWAYRIIDSRAFGLPQRRKRLFILAARNEHPGRILFDGNRVEPEPRYTEGLLAGFYWTEGNTGLGWAVDSVPPLKSTALVVSAPAVWRPATKDFVTPTIEDAEALQGFPRGWTQPAVHLERGRAARWRLVGNAVSVPAARWIGERLMTGSPTSTFTFDELLVGSKWPNAAFGGPGKSRRAVHIGDFPGRQDAVSLAKVLSKDAAPLSFRAASGFLSRLEKSRLRVLEQFRADLRTYVKDVSVGGESGNQHAYAEHTVAEQLA
jgi:DNA (cytosine-5)-methyltransferase 1